MRFVVSTAFIALICSYGGCKKNSQQLTGRYSVCEPTTYEWYTYHRKGVLSAVAGSTLLLRPDSTFTYITCGNVMTGTWQTRNQALLLQATSNRYRIDSLNLTRTCTVSKEPLQYEIESNKLYRVLWFASGPSLELLSKK